MKKMSLTILPFLIVCAVLYMHVSCRSDIPISMETLPQVIKEAFDTVERNSMLSNNNVESSTFCFDFDNGDDYYDDVGSSNCDVCDEDTSSDVLYNAKEDEIIDEDEIYGSSSSDDMSTSACSTMPIARDSLFAHDDCSICCDSQLNSSHKGINVFFALIHR